MIRFKLQNLFSRIWCSSVSNNLNSVIFWFNSSGFLDLYQRFFMLIRLSRFLQVEKLWKFRHIIFMLWISYETNFLISILKGKFCVSKKTYNFKITQKQSPVCKIEGIYEEFEPVALLQRWLNDDRRAFVHIM